MIDLIFANKDSVQIIDTLKYRHAKELKTTSNICNTVVFVRLSNLYIYLTIFCKLSKLLLLPTLHYCYCINDANSFSADIARKKEICVTNDRIQTIQKSASQNIASMYKQNATFNIFTFRIHFIDFAGDSRDSL